MAFVRASANCAPECTHRRIIPSCRASVIALETSWTLNSAHDGGAVRVVRSKRLLQSVIAMSAVSLKVGAEMAGEIVFRVISGFFQSVLGSNSHVQKIRSHASWSKADASEVDSAASVLVTTR